MLALQEPKRREPKGPGQRGAQVQAPQARADGPLAQAQVQEQADALALAPGPVRALPAGGREQVLARAQVPVPVPVPVLAPVLAQTLNHF